MTSPDDVIFLKFSEIHGQYFPLSNFKKKDTLVFSSLCSIRLGLSPKGLVKRKRPSLQATGVARKSFRTSKILELSLLPSGQCKWRWLMSCRHTGQRLFCSPLTSQHLITTTETGNLLSATESGQNNSSSHEQMTQ